MKRIKTISVIVFIIALFTLIDLRFDLIYNLTLQISKEKYISHVANMDYEIDLLNEPICIKDKLSADEELAETELLNIVSRLEMHDRLADEYNLSAVATAKTDFEKVLQVLNWLTEHTYYSGAQMRLLTDNTLDILKYSFDKSFTHAINCRYKAIAFADCLIAVGIQAYPVCMLSADFCGCHFTCMAYITEIGKWCAFDPSFGCWFSDEDGNPVDIFEIREMFLQGLEPTVNGYNFNGTDESFDVYLNGFLKYCISNLSTWENNSMDGRTKKSYSARKQFNAKIPDCL